MQGPDRAGVPGAGPSAVAAGVGSGAQAPGTPGWWSCICPGKGAPSGVDLEGPPDPEAGGSGQVCVFRGVWVRYSVGGHGGHREGRGQVVPKENPLEETTAVDRVEDRSQEPEVAVMERRDPRAVGSRGAQEGRVVWPALSSCLLGGPGLDCALCHLWEGPATAVQRGYWGQLDGSVHFARPGDVWTTKAAQAAPPILGAGLAGERCSGTRQSAEAAPKHHPEPSWGVC